ncbi:MAG: 4-(cytidine 5'-diphospho)-2-C-methyl-D-erythritol kinase [Gammaproteobacteria bacterium]|nr:4-(cytidine 5'-diphospho)-2-C-methyl-D-erythritol kinase [Gammaproteobacteria bacterium]NNJ85093.1 4-(cytidine 5'-diphospho)-2-C-methyl-D-erythritol kinase [Gammaproteobacteria bacterium]
MYRIPPFGAWVVRKIIVNAPITNSWPAPAKINLFLHIIGRRPNGYHNLETVFQFLDLADEVTLEPRRDGRIQRLVDPIGNPGSDLASVPAQQDLTVRAAKILKTATATRLGVDIGITKRIPMGGGLGGGSSDAATTLVGLNRVWGLGLDVDALAKIGVTLGADVPVFVRGQAAFASGIGEKLMPVVLEEPWYLVIYPGCSVATASVFNAPDLTRDTLPIKIHTLLERETGQEGASDGHDTFAEQEHLRSVFSLLTRMGNDCEQVVRRRHPPVDAALDWLSRFGPARMTGTGACVFAPFREKQEAERILAMLPNARTMVKDQDKAWSGFVTRGRNRSLLNNVPL